MRSFGFILFTLVISLQATAQSPIDFDKHVAPLLAARCIECHNPTDRKGKLDLTTAAGLAKGGKDGGVLTAGKPLESPLWDQVNSEEMPPKTALGADEKATIKAWITQGAKWGKTDPIDPYALTTAKRAGLDFWSLQPIKKPAPPAIKDPGWAQNDIDRFILAKLESASLAPNPQADPRTLVRRVYFDLIGLPPTPAEIDAYLKQYAATDPNQAYSQLIDRLLASPHYGERWARHWLDVVRYTESQGFEYDRFRPNAWHYRDYVINSFNADKPYNVFMQEQIAGDVLNFASPPDNLIRSKPTRDGIIATSLLVCGPWDQAGSSQANVTQRMATREEEQEDLVSVIGQSFLGLTVNCARCHNHKFDPIPQADYYRIKSVFDGVKHGERAIDPSEAELAHRNQVIALQKSLDEARQTIETIETQARKQAIAAAQKTEDPAAARLLKIAPVARWTFKGNARDAIGEMHGELLGGAQVTAGRLVLNGDKQFMRTANLKKDIAEKTLEAWVILPTLEQGGGGVITIESPGGVTFDSIVYGERQPHKWIAGSNGFVRTKDLEAPPETAGATELTHIAIVYRIDGTITVYRNGKPYARSYRQDALRTYKAGEAHVLIGLRHSGAANGFLKAEIESAALYDRPLDPQEIADLFAAGSDGGATVSNEQMLAAMNADQQSARDQAMSLAATAQSQLAAIGPVLPTVSYAGLREQPAPTHRLTRGDVKTPAEVVSAGGLMALKTTTTDFGLKPDAPEEQRRVKFAAWLADPANPLPARVMANRIWHYHFGRGIVETPNDFGFSGVRPSHPELLDWLAAELVSGDPQSPWSVKRLHKLILMSATYRQASTVNAAAVAVDSDDAMLWRFAPRRLEGEIVRDAMLAVSGKLNPQLGGPSFRPFIVTNHGSDFYELIDKDTPDLNRRTIYRAHVNSGKSPMLDALDCPDPAVKVPSRRVTTTPLAALALMNNSFVQRQADAFAAGVSKDAGNDIAAAITLAYQRALGRAPTAAEAAMATDLARQQGLGQVCWVLFNATEFLYVK